ncbi:MAG: Sir2 family NAD-dependent protein deacetylase [Sulfuricurvum sp.]|nr:Sir2 family NAD-dependent protein deacetylase [Sulfuricurvum sp.]
MTIRLATIIQRLYEGETLIKADLAQEFNVSEKTIQRDMNERISPVMPIYNDKGIGWKMDKQFQKDNTTQRYAPILNQDITSTHELEINIMQARDALDWADAVLITSGAGMGVDSGLPDFRGTEGFWRAYPPMKELGLSFSDIANPKWFIEDPYLAWGFYGHRLHLYRTTNPNNGFNLLRELVKSKNENYFIFTSNVDGQFQKAGFNPNKIVEIHGSIHFNQCVDTCQPKAWANNLEEVDIDPSSFRAYEKLPKCIYCGKLARPNILMFADWGYHSAREFEQTSRLNTWLRDNTSRNLKTVVIEIGAGKAIPTVRIFSEDIFRQYGAKLIRINPRDYSVPGSAISIPLGGQEGLEKIFQ